MTGDDYRKARKRLRLTHAKIAKALDISMRTSMLYQRADAVPQKIALAIEALEQRRQVQRVRTAA